MNYLLLEKELKKRAKFPYSWGSLQFDKLDKQTNFIYKINSFDSLLERIELDFVGDPKYVKLKNYALNRWFNFWSAKAVEQLFCEHKNVKPHSNKYHKFIDFFIEQIPFDHKTTIFPKGFKKSIPYAIQHKNELIEWLYKNQSQQQRKHIKNRIFIVLANYQYRSEHWELKAEISYLKEVISAYLCNFEPAKLYSFNYDNEVVKADVIWVTK